MSIGYQPIALAIELQEEYLAYLQGFEPRRTVLETVMLPLTSEIHCMVVMTGFEPVTLSV